MNIDTGTESGKLLCQALRLDPREVRAIHIHWQANELPYASVELYLNEQAVHRIIQLRPVDGPSPESSPETSPRAHRLPVIQR